VKWIKWLWEQAFKYRYFEVMRWRPFFLYVAWEPRIGFEFDFDIKWVPWHHACTEERHVYEWRPGGCRGWNSDFALSITLFWVHIAVDIPNVNIIDEDEKKKAIDEMHVEMYAPASRMAKDVHVCGICDVCDLCTPDCCNDCEWDVDYAGGGMRPYCNCEDHSCPTYITAEVNTTNVNLRVQMFPEELSK